jgi:hypothetical protein
MRERRHTLLPTVLALAFVALLVTPIAAMAASGLPATVTMNPESAEPGTTVEVTGLDFPVGQPVQLQLTTTAGAIHLGTATTTDGGYFQEAVTLPLDAPAGFWELRATGADGSVAVHIFEAGEVATALVGDAAAAAAGETEEAATSGNSASDIMVMLIFAVLIAGVGGGIGYVWYQSKLGDAQPGMSAGEDPIWSGADGPADNASEATHAATDEPAWGTARSES